MKSVAGVTSQLQVLPQSVQFDDVSTEQQLHTTVTVKVKARSLLVLDRVYSGSSSQPCKADAPHNLFLCSAEFG